MKYYKNSLPYMAQEDEYNIDPLNRYKEFEDLLDYPVYNFNCR